MHGHQDEVLALVHLVGHPAGPPVGGPGHPAGTPQREPFVQRRERGRDLRRGQQPHPAAGRCAGAPTAAAPEPHGPGPARHPVAEPPVDHALGGPQRRERLAAGRDVGELGGHQRGEQAAAGVIGAHPDPADRGGPEDRAAGHGGPAPEGVGRGHDGAAVVDPQRAFRDQERRPAPPLLVGRRGMVQRPGEHGVGGAQVVGVDGADVRGHAVIVPDAGPAERERGSSPGSVGQLGRPTW